MASITRSEIVFGLVAAAIGGAVVAYANLLITNREMDVKMVEIAVGILSQEPKDSIAPAREWAVDVISYYAGPVRPSDAARSALATFRAVPSFTSGISYSYSYGGEIFDAPAAPPEAVVSPD